MRNPFTKVNEYSQAGAWDFRIHSFDGSRLLIIGSFNLCYYHDVEISFFEVSHINCATEFHAPRFKLRKATAGETRCIIESDDGTSEIVATGVDVRIGKVYHYFRHNLKSEVRMASNSREESILLDREQGN